MWNRDRIARAEQKAKAMEVKYLTLKKESRKTQDKLRGIIRGMVSENIELKKALKII